MSPRIQGSLQGSLRSRILLLAILTGLLLTCAAAALFAFLRNSHTALLSSAGQHLSVVASSFARDYAERPDRTVTLTGDLPPAPPQPHPGQQPAPGQPPAPPPPPPPDPLSLVTANALQGEPGIEGGFYSAASQALVGYAFPTHESPGPQPGPRSGPQPGPRKEMPSRERPTIDSLAHRAVATGQPQTYRFEGPHDAVLFTALPLREQGKWVGAVWLMQRLPGIDSGHNRQLLWGAAGFSLAALLTGLLTFFVISEVQAGVSAVLARLGMLATSFGPAGAPALTRTQLAEFELVLGGIDRLSLALGQKIESERNLESQLRHQERLSALGQFAAGIAHELRNPLATIRLRTQMTQRGDSSAASIDRNTRVVLDEIDRLDSIIGRLLYFSRPIHLHRGPLDLATLCQEAAEAWRQLPAAAGVAIVCTPGHPALCIADPDRLRQVLDNLIENAIQSTHAARRLSPHVRLEVSSTPTGATLSVLDNGAGLDPATQSRAFDPFFTTREVGTGLGLSISYEIARAHGGELTLEPRPEGGARATLALPRIDLPGALPGIEAEQAHP